MKKFEGANGFFGNHFENLVNHEVYRKTFMLIRQVHAHLLTQGIFRYDACNAEYIVDREKLRNIQDVKGSFIKSNLFDGFKNIYYNF